jgi:hypothetical protein
VAAGRLDAPLAGRYSRPKRDTFPGRGGGVDNKDQAAWEAYRQALERPEGRFVGWQSEKGTQVSLCSAKSETPPPSVEALQAVWFFRAGSWREANRAWYARNGWTKAATEASEVPSGDIRVRNRSGPRRLPASAARRTASRPST